MTPNRRVAAWDDGLDYLYWLTERASFVEYRDSLQEKAEVDIERQHSGRGWRGNTRSGLAEDIRALREIARYELERAPADSPGRRLAQRLGRLDGVLPANMRTLTWSLVVEADAGYLLSDVHLSYTQPFRAPSDLGRLGRLVDCRLLRAGALSSTDKSWLAGQLQRMNPDEPAAVRGTGGGSIINYSATAWAAGSHVAVPSAAGAPAFGVSRTMPDGTVLHVPFPPRTDPEKLEIHVRHAPA